MGHFKDMWCGRKLLSAVKFFYEEASACVKTSGETSEHSDIKVGLRQGVSCYHGCSIFIWMVLREK